ncbi:MAG: hypothetical protein ABW186_04925 [Rhodanobacteraceae bacterium]
MSRTRIVIVLASSALAAWFGYIAGARSIAQPPRAPVESAAQATSRAESVATGARKLSSETADLAARYAALAQRAEDGDRESARTLAQDLARCMQQPELERRLAYQQNWVDRHMTNLPAERQASARRRLDKVREDLASARTLCAGVSREQVRSRSYWLYKAAIAGDSASALSFGTGAFIYDDMLGQLEQIPFWRDHARDALERALAGGEKGALIALARAYDPARGDKAGELAFASSAVDAYAFYTALSLVPGWERSVAEDAIARLDPQLTEAERNEALAKAADICLNDLPAICDLPPSPPR